MNLAIAAGALLLLGCPHPAQDHAAAFQAVSSVADTAYIENAADYIQKAFAYDVSNIDPVVQHDHQRVSIWFYPNSQNVMDNYFVQIDPDKQHATMIYHFEHPNIENVDIAADGTFAYDPEIIQIARDYVEKVYDYDCSSDTYKVYGYQNKVAVQFRTADDCFFDVRFFYQDITPTGCLYLTSEAEASAWLEANHGKVFYDSTGSA